MTTLRFALRSLVRTPRLSLAAVACIGLGAAATTAVSTLVAATVLRPLPFPAADRLVRLWWEEDGNPRVSLSIPELRDAAGLQSFEVLLGTARVRAVAVLDGGAQRIRGEGVTPGYFDALGLRPATGRLLNDDDHRPGAPRVVVISHSWWRGPFGSDPGVVGRTLRTERAAYTIVGVAPRAFQGTVEPDVVTFWVPLEQYEPPAMLDDRRQRQSWAIARLREGTSLEAAGAEAHAFGRLEKVPLGYRTEGLARLAFALSRQDVPETSAVPAFRERVRAALLEHPGVEEVGLVWLTLPPWDAERFRIRFAGLDPAVAEEGLDVGGHLADHGLLPALGIPILAGRNFEPADAPAGARVAVVSRSVAERMGGVAAAVGRELVVPGHDPAMPSGAFQVIGVAENVAWDGRREQDTDRLIRFADRGDRRAGREDVYLPLALYPLRTVSAAVAMRGDAAAALEPLRRRIASVTPTSAVQWTSTMREELALEVQPSRFYALLVTAFSTSALVLTAVGVFAVLAHGVSRRTGEIGLRMALGARPRDIAWMVVDSGSRALAAGVAGGLGGALLLGRMVTGVLYEASAFDAPAFAAATLVLALVAVPAALLPARRAARLQPMAALRGRQLN